MKRVFFFITLCTLGVAQTSEFININGYVMEIESDEALPYANIMVKNSDIGTVSNADGYFTLVNVHRDNIALKISYIGFETKTLYLTVEEIEAGPIQVKISPKILQGNQVDVVAVTILQCF